MPKIEVLIGMIASGKSTYARTRADAGALIVAHDDLTAMLHGRYRFEPGLRACYRSMEQWIVHDGLAAGRDVVIDRTHLTRESRARWVAFARNHYRDVRVVAVAFRILHPAEHAARRFGADPRGRSFDDWLGVAMHHHAQAVAEPLSDDEGFDQVLRADSFAVEAPAPEVAESR